MGDAPWPATLKAQAGLAATVFGLAALALALLAVAESRGWDWHGAQPTGWSGLAWASLFIAGWTLMTGAMMLPSSLPFLHAMQRVGGSIACTAAGAAFTGVWVAVGLLQWAALWWVGGALARLGPAAAEDLAGVSLVAAGLYAASPLARACQRACAQPFAILAQHWGRRSRRQDACAAGLHYGLRCVGCCLPMVLLMFVVGAHDLVWMLALALWMVLQKHAVWGARLALPAAATLVLAGLAICGGAWSPPLRGLRELCGGG